jgi:hypothetical protein
MDKFLKRKAPLDDVPDGRDGDHAIKSPKIQQVGACGYYAKTATKKKIITMVVLQAKSLAYQNDSHSPTGSISRWKMAKHRRQLLAASPHGAIAVVCATAVQAGMF